MSLNEKEKKSATFFIVVLVICLIIDGYFLFYMGEGTGDESSEVGSMQQMTRQVRDMEAEAGKKQGEISRLAARYQRETGVKAPDGFDITELNPEERELLEQQINKEKDVSVRSLLKEILKRKDEISQLRDDIAEIEGMLPKPHIAAQGESHYRIALAFLVDEKGVEKERAVDMLARTALFEELAEGFKVWNFYNGEEYGTSVTQGNALVSPNVFVHRAKKKLADARDRALSQRDKLAENIKSLEEKQNEFVTQMDQVVKEKGNLATTINDLNRQINSMFYQLDSQKNLKKKGILKSGFLTAAKLKDVSPEHFNHSLDLAVDDRLTISAQDVGVQKINDVVLYPRFYKKGAAYKVLITRNKKHALLTLMDITKFRSERVVIAVK